MEDGRFRILDNEADVLRQELQLVDAGYVDAVPSRAGRRLAADYVIVGNAAPWPWRPRMLPGLVHGPTGSVVAIVDVISADRIRLTTRAFLNRLPVACGTFPSSTARLLPLTNKAAPPSAGKFQAREQMRFYAIEREPDRVDEDSGAVIIPGASRVGTLEAERRQGGITLRLIEGSLPASGSEVVSE